MSFNNERVNQPWGSQDTQDLDSAIGLLERKLDFLKQLNSEERQHKIRLGVNNLAFVRMAKDAYDEFPVEPESQGGPDGPDEDEAEAEEAVEETKPAEPEGPREFNLKVAGRTMESMGIQISRNPTEMTLNWVDSLSLGDTGGFRLRVEPVDDQKPTAYIQGVDRHGSVPSSDLHAGAAPEP